MDSADWQAFERLRQNKANLQPDLRAFIEVLDQAIRQALDERRLDLTTVGVLTDIHNKSCDQCAEPATCYARYYGKDTWLCNKHAQEFALHYGAGSGDKAGRRRAAEREALGYSSDESSEGEVIFNKVSANVNREF